MAGHRNVRSVERALDLLGALNRTSDPTIGALTSETGLNRTTVYRLLKTLSDAGYVSRSPFDDRFRLTSKVKLLSEGFDDEAWIVSIASPALGRLLRRVTWPTDIATFDQDSMLIRVTTHRFSPFSTYQAMVGQHMPMLRSALGRAYLAFCPETERVQILDILERRGIDARLSSDRTAVDRLIDKTRRQGYAANYGEVEHQASAIALPIFRAGRVLGTLNMIFFSSAMTIAEAVQRHIDDLRATIREIEAGVTTLGDELHLPTRQRKITTE